MVIRQAEFEISCPDVSKCPATTAPEYGFIGRSNVGKSSLINMLTGKSKLAMTSATPGKTLLLNYFRINDSWYIVDLPGYGYAKRGKAEREKLRRMIDGYVLRREQLTCLFVLIDVRHEPQKVDVEFLQHLGEQGVPFAIVFTKADKLPKTRLGAQVKDYLKYLEEWWEELPPHFVTSATTRLGREELLQWIEEVNEGLANQE